MKSIKKQLGLTFLELMVVVGIIATLSMVAIPSYNKYIRRLNRVEVRNTMDQIAQRLEQNFSITRDFTYYYNPSAPDKREGTKYADPKDMMTALGYAYGNNAQHSDGYSVPENRPVYVITLEYIPAPKSDTPTGEELYGPGFKLIAKAVGRQERDSCASFYLNHRNVRKATNSVTTKDWGNEKSRSARSMECWQG